MAKKSKRTPDGRNTHAHTIFCIGGCTHQTKGKGRKTHDEQVPTSQLPPGWKRGENWSTSRQNQFPWGVPKDGDGR